MLYNIMNLCILSHICMNKYAQRGCSCVCNPFIISFQRSYSVTFESEEQRAYLVSSSTYFTVALNVFVPELYFNSNV